MTPAEATKVADIAMLADGGCSICAAELLRALASAFPGIDWLDALSDPSDRTRIENVEADRNGG